MTTATTHLNPAGAAWCLRAGIVTLALAAALTAEPRATLITAPAPPARAAVAAPAARVTPAPARRKPAPRPPAVARTWKIHYRAWNGADRLAYVILPASYGPHHNPPLPLVISPHGRGGNGKTNAEYWGHLPAVGGFAVVNPDGMGRVRGEFSYAAPGHIDDLARMPQLVTKALPWLRIDRRRVYALGSSMGGQETLMLVARHPRLLAGAVAMDSVADLVRRYPALRDVPCNADCVRRFGRPYGEVVQEILATEVGSVPSGDPAAWASRSPQANVESISKSGVPLQIWWSSTDRIIPHQERQSGTLYRTLSRMSPQAPLCEYAGHWAHSAEMRYDSLLWIALQGLDLVPHRDSKFPGTVRCTPGPGGA